MLTRIGLSEVLGISIDAVHKRIEAGTIPQFDFYDYRGEQWHESTVLDVIAKIEADRIDYDTVLELAKTKTIPEISRAINATPGRVKWFCIKNNIQTKSRGRGRPEVKETVRRSKKPDTKQIIFNNLLKQMRG